MPVGVRLRGGFPFCAGLRAGDVVVDSDDGLLLSAGVDPPRFNADVSVRVDVERGLTFQRGSSSSRVRPREFARGLELDVVDDASLVGEVRVVAGHRVVGPRRVVVVERDGDFDVETFWDVVEVPVRRLRVRQWRQQVTSTTALWRPGGLRFRDLQPHHHPGADEDDSVFGVNERWGALSAEVAKRFLVDAGPLCASSWIGWDGRVHVADDAVAERGERGERAERTWWFVVNAVNNPWFNSADDATVDAAFGAVVAAADDVVASVVAGLRPQLVQTQRAYLDELAILAAGFSAQR